MNNDFITWLDGYKSYLEYKIKRITELSGEGYRTIPYFKGQMIAIQKVIERLNENKSNFIGN